MIVGLTGGIGSGKTTVAKFFEKLGVPVYNSDKEAKRLMVRSKKVKNAIVELLGEDSYKGQKLNKTYISEKIFNDKSVLEAMNAIVHPAVRKDFLKWVKKQDTPYVIQETALLFENLNRDFYDVVVLVTAPKKLRVERVVTRDETSEEQVVERMNNQLDDKEKIPFSDYIIENINLEKTRLRVHEVHLALLENI